MPSFRQLLAAHSPLLLLDAAASRVQVGWLENGHAGRWETSAEEAGIGIFRCLESLRVDVDQAQAFVFCDGPGSVLGIRTAAMALRTWSVLKLRPIFAYSSLALVGHALGQTDVGVILDARRDSWHHFQLGLGLRRVAAAELTGTLVMPEHFRHWAPLPSNVARTGYDVAKLLTGTANVDLFRTTDEPDAFLHAEPSYVTWTQKIHRAPSAP